MKNRLASFLLDCCNRLSAMELEEQTEQEDVLLLDVFRGMKGRLRCSG